MTTGMIRETTGASAIDVVALSYGEGAGAPGRACDSVRVHSAPCTLYVRLTGQPAEHKYELKFFNAGDTVNAKVAKIWGTADGTTNAIDLDLGWST